MSTAVDIDDYFCQECGIMMACSHIDLVGRIDELIALRNQIVSNGYFIVRRKLPNNALSEAFQNANKFFCQTIELKEQAYSLDRARRGYSSVHTDNFASLSGFKKPNDIVEKFRIGPVDDHSLDEYYASKEGRVHFFPNTWPNHIDGFQCAVETYYQEMTALSCLLLAMLERLFDLPVDSLVKTMERHTSILGLNAYLPLDAYPPSVYEEHLVSKAMGGVECSDKVTISDHKAFDDMQNAIIERVAEHVDVSVFTIVAEACLGVTASDSSASMMQDGTLEEGEDHKIKLQMYNNQVKAWEDVNLSSDCFLVNVGECLSDWTRCSSPATMTTSSPISAASSSALPALSSYYIPPARHRVIETLDAPSATYTQSSRSSRYSMAFFCAPSYTAPLVWPNQLVSSEQAAGELIREGGSNGLDAVKVLDYGKWRQKKIKETVRIIKSAKQT